MTPRLDPAVRAWLEAAQSLGKPPLSSLTPEEARAAAIEMFASFGGSPEPVARVEDLHCPIPIRVYTPDNEAAHPGLVFFHGGGWVLCNLDTHDVVCRAIARRAGAVVVSVGYRLAPEHPFPAAVTDCHAATLWTAENAARLAIDPSRVAALIMLRREFLAFIGLSFIRCGAP